MNRTQYLLCKLAEESVEVAQITLKSQQFGIHEVFPGQPLSNGERIHLELDDLNAQIEMLNEESGFSYVPNRARMDAKKEKVNRYYEYSKDLAQVS